MISGVNKLQRLLGMDATAAAVEASAAELTAAAYVPRQTRQVGVSSAGVFAPDDQLTAVVWADLVGDKAPQLSRAAVMQIPALARQRHLITTTAARCPLVLFPPDGTDPAMPTWHTRTDGELSPYHRMLWTVDDLLFYGWSVWRARRGGRGELLAADRVPYERWETDEADRLVIDGEPVDAADAIVIPGPHEGVLSFGRGALIRTLDNLDAAANAARNPSAYLELHYTGDEPLTDPEIDAHIGRWAAARRGENGGVAWTNKLLELKEHGTHESHLLIEGRNADAVDVSRLVSAPAAMADATNAGASLTYETTSGRNAQFLDYGAGVYMDSVAAALSQNNVTPNGWRVAFDTSELRDAPPSPTDDPAAGPPASTAVTPAAGSPTPGEDTPA